jgi:hypothetical protein
MTRFLQKKIITHIEAGLKSLNIKLLSYEKNFKKNKFHTFGTKKRDVPWHIPTVAVIPLLTIMMKRGIVELC